MIAKISRASRLSVLHSVPQRAFGIYTPKSKLHFEKHPEHGKVYPIASYNFDKNWFTVPFLAS